MNKKPLVSIVLPTFNGERYLRQSIGSVISQQYKNWELIIVDDHSTDSTSAIIDEFTDTDSRIKVIHNSTNQKLPKSLNIGFEKAKGDLLTWTSDDNLYLPNALGEMVDIFLSDSDLGFVFCAQEIIDQNGMPIESGVPKYKLFDLAYKNICGKCQLVPTLPACADGGILSKKFYVVNTPFAMLQFPKDSGCAGWQNPV